MNHIDYFFKGKIQGFVKMRFFFNDKTSIYFKLVTNLAVILTIESIGIRFIFHGNRLVRNEKCRKLGIELFYEIGKV